MTLMAVCSYPSTDPIADNPINPLSFTTYCADTRTENNIIDRINSLFMLIKRNTTYLIKHTN